MSETPRIPALPVLSPARGVIALPGDGTLDVFDMMSGEHVASPELPSPEPGFWSVDFKRDGTRLLGLSPNREEIVTWETTSWEVVDRVAVAEIGAIDRLEYSLDDRLLIAADPQGALVLRDPETYAVIAGPLPIDASGWSVASLSRDGTRVVVATASEEILLWDLEEQARIGGNLPGRFQFTSPETWATWAFTFLENSILIWNLNTDQWFDIACRAAGRNMTRGEWEEFGPAADYHATCPQWPVEE